MSSSSSSNSATVAAVAAAAAATLLPGDAKRRANGTDDVDGNESPRAETGIRRGGSVAVAAAAVAAAVAASADAKKSAILRYADCLRASSGPNSPLVEAYGANRPDEFVSMCKSHLSLLVDLAFDIELQSLILPPTSIVISDNVIGLMEYLTENSNSLLCVEGVFRKNGSISRQRQLSNRLLGSVRKMQFPLEDGNFGVHDYAATLKTVLKQIQPLVLTEELLPTFDSVAQQLSVGAKEVGASSDSSLSGGGCGSSTTPHQLQGLIEAKQLTALRLLRLLLPKQNQRLLQCLLHMLSKTADLESSNRMTAQSLGTLFGPILFAPNDISPAELQSKCATWSCLVTQMIKLGADDIFAIPRTLLDDIEKSLRRQEMPTTDTVNLDDSIMDVPKTFRFVDRSRKAPASATTDYAVAELCATVLALPNNDPRKTSLLRKINRTNGGLGSIEITQQFRHRLRPRSLSRSPATATRRRKQ